MNKNTINMLLDPNVFNSKLISLVKECPEIYNTKYKGYKGEIIEILKFDSEY